MNVPPGLWWRMLLSTAAVLILVVLGGEVLVSSALPAVGWLMGFLAAELQVQTLAIESTAAGRLVVLEVSLDRTLVVGGRAFVPAPGSAAQASTLALQCLHGPVVAVAVALAWPGLMVARLFCVALLSAALALADLSAVLAGSVWQVVIDLVQPADHTPLLVWKAFISQGGRWALGLVAGVAAIGLCAQHPAPPVR